MKLHGKGAFLIGATSRIGAVVFLAGPDPSFMTGQVVPPNGGIYMSQ